MNNKRIIILQKLDIFKKMYQYNLIHNSELLDEFKHLEESYNCKINPVTLDITFKRGRRKKHG